MIRYELVQPSDDYEFDAPDDDIATAVAVICGDYVGWERPGGEGEDETVVHVPGFGAALGTEEEAKAKVEEIGQIIETRPAEVAAALRTIEIQPDRRARLGVDPDVWHDEMRTSMSDFRAVAQQYAAALEAKAAG